MNIVKVSMIGANENLPVRDVVDFLRAYPMAEIGVGVSADKGAYGTTRFEYVKFLRRAYMNKYASGKIGTIALHINGNGKDGLCGWPARVACGVVPNDLLYMMDFPGMSIQLNHRGYDFTPSDAGWLARASDLWWHIAPRARLILSYCENTADYIDEFKRIVSVRNRGELKWDVLYDASFGRGKVATQYAAPLYHGVRQGYAGGLGPDNIEVELPKISAIQTNPTDEIWIDAEGKLQTDDKKTLDLTKAELFYKKIMDFQRTKTK